jgi:hypothetical protein
MPSVQSAIWISQPSLTGVCQKHTLQVNSGFGRRQRKPVQLRPGLCVEVGFSAPFSADSTRKQASAL